VLVVPDVEPEEPVLVPPVAPVLPVLSVPPEFVVPDVEPDDDVLEPPVVLVLPVLVEFDDELPPPQAASTKAENPITASCTTG